MSLLKKCKVGVRRDMEKKEKAVFGILVLGKDWRKINVFQVLGDSGMRLWEKKRCDNPVFGRIMSDLEQFWERKKVRMIKKGFKGRCQKRQMKKCKEVVRTYGAIQLAYAERLEQEDSIIEFQCNVMLSGLEAGEYSSDFVCEKQNGDLMVRECVERRFLKKPMTVKLLDASRECWTRIKKLLMMLL